MLVRRQMALQAPSGCCVSDRAVHRARPWSGVYAHSCQSTSLDSFSAQVGVPLPSVSSSWAGRKAGDVWFNGSAAMKRMVSCGAEGWVLPDGSGCKAFSV